MITRTKELEGIKFQVAEDKYGSKELEVAMESLELNLCDKCTRIELSKDLFWLESLFDEDEISIKQYNQISKNGKFTALCNCCYNKMKGA